MPSKVIDLCKLDSINTTLREDIESAIKDMNTPKTVVYHHGGYYPNYYDDYDNWYDDDNPYDLFGYGVDCYSNYRDAIAKHFLGDGSEDYDDEDTSSWDEDDVQQPRGRSSHIKKKKKVRRQNKKAIKKRDVDTIWPPSSSYDEYDDNSPITDAEWDEIQDRTFIRFYRDITREDEYIDFKSLKKFDEFIETEGYDIDAFEAECILNNAECHVTVVNNKIVCDNSFGSLYWSVTEMIEDDEDYNNSSNTESASVK